MSVSYCTEKSQKTFNEYSISEWSKLPTKNGLLLGAVYAKFLIWPCARCARESHTSFPLFLCLNSTISRHNILCKTTFVQSWSLTISKYHLKHK